MKVAELWVEIDAKLDKFNKGFSDVEKAMMNVGKKLDRVGKKLTTHLTLPLVAAGGAALKFSIDFNKSMANVATLIAGPGGTTDRITELKKAVQDMAMETGKSTGDIAGGLYQVISAFQDTNDTVKILDINVRAAAAGMSTTTDAINLTSAVTKGYGDTTAKAVQKASDLAFMTVKLGQTTFPELAEAIGYVVPIASQLNIKQEELFAGFATLTGVTGNASKVSTQFAGILRSMIKPTDTMKKSLAKVGEQIGLGSKATAEAIIKKVGFKKALELLVATTDGTTRGLAKLFMRVEGLTGLLPLVTSQSKTYNEKLKAMGGSAGATDTAFKEMTEGVNKTGHEFEKFKQTVIVTAQQFGDELGPAFADATRYLKNLAEKFSKLTDEEKKNIIKMGALVAAMGPVLSIFGKFLKLAAAMRAINMKLATSLGKVGAVGAAAFVGWKIGRLIGQLKIAGKTIDDHIVDKLKGLTDAIVGVNKEVEMGEGHAAALEKRQKMLADASEIAGKAITNLHDAMDVLAGRTIRSEERTKAVTDAMGEEETQADAVAAAMKTFNAILEDNGDATDEAIGKAEEFAEVLSNTVVPALNNLDGVAYNTQENIKSHVFGANDDIEEDTKATLENTGTFWDDFADGLQTKWATTIGEILSGATSLKEGLKGIWDAIKTQFFDMIGQMIAKWVTNLLSEMLTSATKTASDIGSSFKRVGEAVAGVGTTIGGIIVSLAKAIASAAKIIAGAAKEIAITAGLALAIYASFRLIKGLFDKVFGGGGGGGDTTMKWHLEHIWINTKEMRDWMFTNAQARLDEIARAVTGTLPDKSDTTRIVLRKSRDLLKDIKAFAKTIASNTKSLKGAKFAAYGMDETVYKPTMIMAGEKGIEHVKITPRGQGGGGGGGVSLNYAPVIYAMDSQDVYKFMEGKGRKALVTLIENNVGGITRIIKNETEKY